MRTTDGREFSAFVSEVSPGLLTTAWALSGDPRRAEDLVQLVLAGLHGRWKEVRRQRPVAAAERAVLVEHGRLRQDADGQAKPSPAHGAPAAVETVGPLGLTRALELLPVRERDVVVLRHYLEQSEASTAELLGVDLEGVRRSDADGLTRLVGLMNDPDDPLQLDRGDVVLRLGRAGVDAPPMLVSADSVLARSRRTARRRRRRVAGAVAVAAAALATWVGVAGLLDDPVPMPTTAPSWDVSRDFAVDVEIEGGHGAVLPEGLRIVREAGADRFSVTHDGQDGAGSMVPVDGDLPGRTQLFEDGRWSVILTPVPPGLQATHTEVVFDRITAGQALTRVVSDGGQGLLVHVVAGPPTSAPVRPVEVLWVADGTVVLASGGTVHQAALGGGAEADAFLVPQHDLLGLLRPGGHFPLVFGSTGTGVTASTSVGAAGAYASGEDLPSVLLTLLDDGATDPRLRLDDAAGTQLPMHKVRLGPHVAASVLVLDGAPARDEDGQPAVTWTGPDGRRQSLADARADLSISFGEGSFRFRREGEELHVTGGGVVATLPLGQEGGVAPLTTTTRQLAVLTGWDHEGEGEPVLVPDTPAPAALTVVFEQLFVAGGTDELSALVVELAPTEGDWAAPPLTALRMDRDSGSCTLTAPQGLDAVAHPLVGGELSGTALYLPESDALAVCFGEIAVGGRVDPGTVSTMSTEDADPDVRVHFSAPGEQWAAEPGWSHVSEAVVTDDLTVTALVRQP